VHVYYIENTSGNQMVFKQTRVQVM